jgi:hypothetical protein
LQEGGGTYHARRERSLCRLGKKAKSAREQPESRSEKKKARKRRHGGKLNQRDAKGKGFSVLRPVRTACRAGLQDHKKRLRLDESGGDFL